jgi:hypothetical protein
VYWIPATILCIRFPFLYPRNRFTGKPTHLIPYYTELDALDKGWRKAFGIYICKDLKRALLEDGGRKKLRGYRIEQIKEKFGELCWYDHGGNEETNRIIYKYTYISLHTCIVCGKSADYVTRGWIEPYCKEHLPDHIDPNDPEQVHEYFTEDFKFYGVYRISFNEKKEPKDNGTEEETTGGN